VRVIAEQLMAQCCMPGPAMYARAGAEQLRDLIRCHLGERHKIDRLPPGDRLLGASSCHHLSDYGRKHGRRVLPSNQIEALEGLVYEIERVAHIRKSAVGLGCEQRIGQHRRRATRRNRGEQGALGGLTMAHLCPAAQPALKHGRIRPAGKRHA